MLNQQNLLIVVGAILSMTLPLPAYAEFPSKLRIDDSYIVTFRPSTATQPSPISPKLSGKPFTPPKFGEHSTGQSKAALASDLGIRGTVASIFESTNAAHLRIDADDAERLRKDPRVLRVEQNLRARIQATQYSPGWGLDRLDQATTTLNLQYTYTATGAGQTIYVLDSGLDLGNNVVAAEFGTRATVFWDVNGGNGADCHGHGTKVASIAGGNTYGVAKGANLIIAKITAECTDASNADTWIQAFNWLAVNAPAGTIVNLSATFWYGPFLCNLNPMIVPAVEDAIRAAHDAGIIVVVSAGNDGCDTAKFTPSRMPEVFAVGASGHSRLSLGQDARWPRSRYGTNVSAFAPGVDVLALDHYGYVVSESGTSLAAPYIAGLFAAGCQSSAPFCSNISSGTVAYNALKNIGTMGTVVNADGTALPSGTPSRFIHRSGW